MIPTEFRNELLESPPDPFVARAQVNERAGEGRDADDGVVRGRGVPDEENQVSTWYGLVLGRPGVAEVPPDITEGDTRVVEVRRGSDGTRNSRVRAPPNGFAAGTPDSD